MAFAKLTCGDNDDIKSFGWFSVGEFFAFRVIFMLNPVIPMLYVLLMTVTVLANSL